MANQNRFGDYQRLSRGGHLVEDPRAITGGVFAVIAWLRKKHHPHIVQKMFTEPSPVIATFLWTLR